MRLFLLHVLASLLLLFPRTADAAYLQWHRLPLRTEAQRAASLMGGEGFQQTQALAYAPSAPNIVYMATDTSQIWKSTDGGVLWGPAGRGFPLRGAVSLFVDPVAADTVLAAGSLGEPYARGRKYKDRVQGICRSEDGGRTWKLVLRTDFFRQETKGQLFAAVPGREGMSIYCGTWDDGLLVSRDRGRTWGKTPFGEKRIRDIAILPGEKECLLIASESGLFHFTPGGKIAAAGKGLPAPPLSISVSAKPEMVTYAVCGDNSIYLSRDMGRNFLKRTPSPIIRCSFAQIDTNPQAGNLAIALTAKSSFCNGIWVSRDSGRSWRQVKRTTNDALLPRKRLGQWVSGPVAFHPQAPAVALVGINGYDTILRTTDGGVTWGYSASGFSGGRMKAMAFPGKNRIIVALTDFGLWESRDNGATFRQLDTGKLYDHMSSSSVDASGDVILASLGSWHQKGVVLSLNSGKSWRRVDHINRKRAPAVLSHPQDNNILYAAASRSLDGGRSWQMLEREILAVFPQNGDIVYSLQERRGGSVLLRSSDRGTSWHEMSNRLTLPPEEIRDVAVHPRRPDTVLLATSQGVAKLSDGKWSMRNHAHGLTRDTSGMCFVEKVSFDPVRPNVVYAGRRAPGHLPANGVFRSEDGGETWESISGNLPERLDVFGLEVSPYDGRVFIGTSLGTYFSSDQKLGS